MTPKQGHLQKNVQVEIQAHRCTGSDAWEEMHDRNRNERVSTGTWIRQEHHGTGAEGGVVTTTRDAPEIRSWRVWRVAQTADEAQTCGTRRDAASFSNPS